MLRRVWAWYKRIGPSIELYTALSPADCQQRLRAATSDWNIPYQITMKSYSAKINPDGTFLLQKRFGFSLRARRPFVGKMEITPGGGTHITGYIENPTSFSGFLLFLLIFAPPVSYFLRGTTGLILALSVCILLMVAALFAHYLEKYSTESAAIYQWLYKILDGKSTVIDAPAKNLTLKTP